MLLLHQTGSVKVGEVVRYTLTYDPSADRILPPPTHLHVKIKNSSAIPLRAAYLHGPYTLYVSCYPSTFDPNQKHVNIKQEGGPDFEPNLKAGGHWTTKLTVPEVVRHGAGGSPSRQSPENKHRSFTWIIEVSSQVLFSTSAAVHFELLVGRDERSTELGFHGMVGSGQGIPGRLEDHQQGRRRNAAQPKGVFSRAVRLAVDDTESLWNTPSFPTFDEAGNASTQQGPTHGDKRDVGVKTNKKANRKQQKVHLVLLTHGLHSNLGADMLYLKESIDTAAKQARQDAKERKAQLRRQEAESKNLHGRPAMDQRIKSTPEIPIAPSESAESDDDDDDDEEEVIVRGFGGNAVKTERGIQYLGKRFAKYVLSITYPDQPYLPVKSSISKSITRTLTNQKSNSDNTQSHRRSSIVRDDEHTNRNLAYKITSISFIGHSLGGLTQTYAVAYIQKHSPDFFDRIKPINFVALATPFLGLSNENPMYVRFALDFGLVGRTGQDLGLTWRTPTIARSGWQAVVGGLGQDSHKAQKQPNPGAKPLLRILPTGPAHVALKRFRNRSLYSNVVNDGIVPLRTSCLLFLDWRGLERVEKARRDNGLVGTVVGWGWAEVTGQNASAPRRQLFSDLFNDSGDERSHDGRSGSPDPGKEVPSVEAGEAFDDETGSMPDEHQYLDQKPCEDEVYDKAKVKDASQQQPSAWAGLLALFKPQAGSNKPQQPTPKSKKIYSRGQTMRLGSQDSTASVEASSLGPDDGSRRGLVRGSSLYTDGSENGNLEAPPKTTIFESAGDILNPPLPSKEFLLDPAARPRTIFHDRIYHPEDIPAPPTKKQRTLLRRMTSKEQVPSEADIEPDRRGSETGEVGNMKIEEKIARAYHKDLSWRKVLVRLEPDAHNNLIVRRMFANAYGWPVVKHLCDTHFAYTAAAETRDEDEEAIERAKPAHSKVGPEGEQVKGQVDLPDEENRDKGEGQDNEGKAKSFDNVTDVAALTKPTTTASDLQKDIQKLRLQEREHKRSESEIRESADEVPEMPSNAPASASNSYSSLKSGQPPTPTILRKTTRDDSSRWSDRFFEGSDDEGNTDEDDEHYLREWRKAKARGEAVGFATGGGGGNAKAPSSATASESKQLVPDQPLTASPKQSTLDLKKKALEFPGDQARTSADPQFQASTGDNDDPSSGMTGSVVGLRKSPHDEVLARVSPSHTATDHNDANDDDGLKMQRELTKGSSRVSEKVALTSSVMKGNSAHEDGKRNEE